MLTIRCPWCGERSEIEFACGGEANLVRPDDWEGVSDDDWSRYLHMRSNPRGVLLERWVHEHGCGEWFTIARNTVTSEILQVQVMVTPKTVAGSGD